MNNSRKSAVCGMLAAIYFALSALVITTGSLKITLTSLAIVVAALLYGPGYACAVALVGELLYQVLLYGVTATLPLWLLPPVLHALCLGLCARLLGKEVPLYRRTWPCLGVCLGCGALNALFNTLALYLDSKYWGYYSPELIFGLALLRVGLALGTALVVAAIAIPLIRTLRDKNLVPS